MDSCIYRKGGGGGGVGAVDRLIRLVWLPTKSEK